LQDKIAALERRFFLASKTEPRGSHVALNSLQAKMCDESSRQ
jgi:hypothetical protein